MRLILHIGAPKSGTSHLQNSLKESAADLRQSGFLYPETGRVFNDRLMGRHIGVRLAHEPPEQRLKGLIKKIGYSSPERRLDYARAFWPNLRTELEHAKGVHTVIMSDESLFTYSSEDMIKNLSRAARKQFERVDIVAFLRSPVSYLSSRYSQNVKMGGATD